MSNTHTHRTRTLLQRRADRKIPSTRGFVVVKLLGPLGIFSLTAGLLALVLTTDTGVNGGSPQAITPPRNGIAVVGSAKIAPVTISHPYDINGTPYATYVPTISGGTRVEVAGTLTLGNGETIIDFDRLERSSELWLFSQVAAFGPRWGDLAVILTPEFDGSVWYEKDVLHHRLIIHGSRDGDVSYRLTAPRSPR